MPKFAYSFICDDIRRELGGKRTYVGVYGDRFTVKSFPKMVSKLCIGTRMFFSSQEEFNSLQTRIEFNEFNEIIPFDHEEVENMKEKIQNNNGEDGWPSRRTEILAEVSISPFEFSEPGTLKIFVETDIDSIRSGILKIQKRHN